MGMVLSKTGSVLYGLYCKLVQIVLEVTQQRFGDCEFSTAHTAYVHLVSQNV